MNSTSTLHVTAKGVDERTLREEVAREIRGYGAQESRILWGTLWIDVRQGDVLFPFRADASVEIADPDT